MLGVCADPGHPEITAESVLESGAQAVSLVMKVDDNDLRLAFARKLREGGCDVLGVVTDETVDVDGVGEAAVYLKSKGWGDVLTHMQLLNEPDLKSPSSDTKTQIDSLDFVYEWLGGWGPRGNVIVLAGGFASGDPSWVDPIWPELSRVVDGIAIHAYGMNPQLVLSKRHNLVGNHPATWHWGRSSIRAGFGWGFGDLSALVTSYQQLGQPVYISEIGAHASDFDDEHQRAQYTSNTIAELGRLRIPSWWFSLGPNMVPGYDLIAPDGTVLESYAAVVNSFP